MNKMLIDVAKAVVLSAMQDERVQAQVKQVVSRGGETLRAWAAEAPRLRPAK